MTSVFLQNACFNHRFIRSRDTSNIVERPERLRAVLLGVTAALSRLDEEAERNSTYKPDENKDPESDIIASMNRMILNRDGQGAALTIHRSTASVDLLNHLAVKFIHGDIEGDTYLENLKLWAAQSRDKVENGQSEIPDGLSQGDLYLCPESIDAIQGALGTVCEAVDHVLGSTEEASTPTARRAFVAVRPPGHHCGEDTPSGFCFVNNVAVGAAHAHLKHGIKRVVILDIDLHHGNGTQSIVWQVNEETYRQSLEAEHGAPIPKPGPQVYYGSIHDILSYPCEDGKADLVQAASTSIHGNHGQFIENIHFEEYSSDDHFWNDLYKNRYARLISKAQQFLDQTGGPGDDVLVFISCGFDACEHEYESMSRHNRKVPASFYHRFTRDVCEFAQKYARGRLISVLEGGYSDRALTSGTMAHLCGLATQDGIKVQEEWWNVENLTKLEKAAKKRRGGRSSMPGQGAAEQWLTRCMDEFWALEGETPKAPAISAPPAPLSMKLRARKSANPSPASSPSVNKTKATKTVKREDKEPALPSSVSAGNMSDESALSSIIDESDHGTAPAQTVKKLPRVTLRLGPRPDADVEGA
ncbi:hypothetical protein HGRIS_006192 [Hohenbuehelia grisea]|uniref:Histone deacetylase domain-containing protein n=1 Tax=Hohenbuehelia grisea TaxID=104357 RepID=A0ABR3K1J5_9AGAR